MEICQTVWDIVSAAPAIQLSSDKADGLILIDGAPFKTVHI